jgi:uncharacterized protein
MSSPADSPLSFRYRTALVTGASSGLGLAFASMLLDNGVAVWGTSRSPDRLASREGFHPAALDLADRASIDSLWTRVEAESGGIDLLVNNGGFGVFSPFENAPSEIWEEQLVAMLGGTLRLCHWALPAMRRRRRGAIVNISSLAAEFPIPYMSGYNVAKAGLSALSRSLQMEAEGSGVAIIDFRPGDYRTSFNRAMEPAALASMPERPARVWTRLEAMMAHSPEPSAAADDLRRALIAGRSGVVRAGGFFQARLAPLLSRFISSRARAGIERRYFRL